MSVNGVKGKTQKVKYMPHNHIRRVTVPDFLLVLGGLVSSIVLTSSPLVFAVPGQRAQCKRRKASVMRQEKG